MRVAVGGQHFEHAVVDREKSHIEGSTSQIEHQDVLLAALLVQTVSDGCCGGFVDDALHRHARDGACVFRGLSLGVVEVRWHGHDCVVDLFS
mmetsp:Transcript_15871/g.21707  ORF Transcript_15871/g.21707 Transcript_15871/m.21707 type:complete len:92 (-) Transcript_15871:524-799(-)